MTASRLNLHRKIPSGYSGNLICFYLNRFYGKLRNIEGIEKAFVETGILLGQQERFPGHPAGINIGNIQI